MRTFVHDMKLGMVSLRSSSSPEDKGACNSAYLQYKRRNSNIADKTFNSTFLIKKKKLFYIICYVTIAPE